MMNETLACLVVAATLVSGACGSTKRQPPLLASPSEVRQLAETIGCERAEPDYFGADAFSCTKRFAPCGCTLSIKSDTTDDANPRVNLVRIDLVGCRAGEASGEIAQLLDVLVKVADRESLHEFVSRPHLVRTEEQEAQFATLQVASYGSATIRVLFGAQSSRNIGAARRTIWTDPAASSAREELLPDVPTVAQCASAEDSPEAGRGYCDTAPQGVDPCALDITTRSRYRRRIALVVSKTLAAWREAIRTLMREGKLQRAGTIPPEPLAQALAGVLPRASDAEPITSQASIRPGITGLQLAAEAAVDWRDRLMWNAERLFDADLAALVVALPAPEEVSAKVFAERIRRRLKELSIDG